MKLKLIISVLIFLILVSAIFIFFQQTQQSKLPVYWEVWSGQDFRGYVVPSIHVSRYSYKNHIAELIKNVDIIALEVDLKEPNNLTAEGQNIELTLSENSTTFFKTLFGNQTWETLRTKKPGIIFSYVLNRFAAEHGMINKMDLDAMKIATENGKQLVGLEKLESQIIFIVNDTYQSEWLNRLEWISQNYFWLITELDLLDIFYKKGDPEGFKELYKLIGENSTVVKDEQTLRDPVLQKRSKEILKENKALVMVGAVHVQGVLDFLKTDFNLKEVGSSNT
ncbi:MAG: TraB/GumN family protein [Candidatus Aenigmarchaeota archaeon]|nr:TraB/GumN family protein [Candidatus Aenigmarchaeota archaeon]